MTPLQRIEALETFNDLMKRCTEEQAGEIVRLRDELSNAQGELIEKEQRISELEMALELAQWGAAV